MDHVAARKNLAYKMAGAVTLPEWQLAAHQLDIIEGQ